VHGEGSGAGKKVLGREAGPPSPGGGGEGAPERPCAECKIKGRNKKREGGEDAIPSYFSVTDPSGPAYVGSGAPEPTGAGTGPPAGGNVNAPPLVFSARIKYDGKKETPWRMLVV